MENKDSTSQQTDYSELFFFDLNHIFTSQKSAIQMIFSVSLIPNENIEKIIFLDFPTD